MRHGCKSSPKKLIQVYFCHEKIYGPIKELDYKFMLSQASRPNKWSRLVNKWNSILSLLRNKEGILIRIWQYHQLYNNMMEIKIIFFVFVLVSSMTPSSLILPWISEAYSHLHLSRVRTNVRVLTLLHEQTVYTCTKELWHPTRRPGDMRDEIFCIAFSH